jgi:peptidoglycan/LPS O-acetylase OafA/YrhL
MERATGPTIMPAPMVPQRDPGTTAERDAAVGSSTPAYRPELDGIRGIAILLVLAQHINLPSSTLAGLVGVNLFFVLSGYLITSLLIKEQDKTGRIDLRRFYERRIRRLIPALVAVLIATGVLMVAFGRIADYPFQAIVSLFYAADIAKAMNLNLGYLGHTWSLALEEQFYLIWPALLIFLPRRFLAPIAIIGIVVAVALQFLLVPDNVLAHFRPDVRADAILWGCLIALVPVAIPRWASIAGLIGVIVLSFTPFWWPHAISVASVLSALVVAGAGSLTRGLCVGPLVRIGQISYGMYLWHAIPVGLFEKETLAGNVFAMAAVVAITIGVALISERWIERPFRKRRQEPVSGFASDPAPSPAPT